MAAYRAGTLALDQLTAFCVSEDQDRQRQVLEQVGPHTPRATVATQTPSRAGADRRKSSRWAADAPQAAAPPRSRVLETR
ncbi:MAG: hypothetical protein K5831_15210 [Brevundimonas sp.]|nr:hypothetical protein [Brevundimonas sp.]